MRLNSYIAKAGITSRRKADEFIKAGRITVNGRAGQLNDEVDAKDEVKLDGKAVLLQRHRYIILYKPAHVVTTLKDTENRPTVASLVEIDERVVPVGRLDTNTTGVLLLTNDGELAHKLMHPSFEIEKVYEAVVEGEVTADKLEALKDGVVLHDGKTAPAKILAWDGSKITLSIHEGRNHQVKRMFNAVGLKVKQLHRPKYGPLTLEGLKPGEWRELHEDEVVQLKH